jgi:hypothetical protein
MKKEKTVTLAIYRNLLQTLEQVGDFENLQKVVENFLEEGREPDAQMFACVLKTWIKSRRNGVTEEDTGLVAKILPNLPQILERTPRQEGEESECTRRLLDMVEEEVYREFSGANISEGIGRLCYLLFK